MIRVAIADDLDMIRAGFELIIENESDMSVVASVGDGRAIIEACRTRHVDVVLMDIRMPELDGLTATERIMTQEDPPRVVILTTFGLDEYVSAAIVAGASGFLLKDASATSLLDAIRAVAAGDVAIAPSLVRTVVQQARNSPRVREVPGIDELTERELEVLQHLAAGRSNAEIAEQLYLSEATVKTHLSRVLAKLGVRDRVQAVIAAFAAGIADATDVP
ncbi:MAG: response regulator transcription factor [Acidimicrobiales bacterium]|nr:response regulator transcription factor [Acidimicrobiia bacterium]NNF53674.1 response regulator transcription factor [Acidimicrobiales bacterium]